MPVVIQNDFPTEILDEHGRYALDGIQIEVEENGIATGKIRFKHRPGETFRPAGEWPGQWGDFTHEADGHGLDAIGNDNSGEAILGKELMSLYAEHGVEMAYDDVSGAHLDPGLVHEARATEITYFKNMGVYDKGCANYTTPTFSIKPRWGVL